MSRAVTADHVLFNECIEVFRYVDDRNGTFNHGKSKSYLLTSFEIPEMWQLPHCTVNPSKRVSLPREFTAFVSCIDNPDWVGSINSHLYGLALASIFSFASGKVCKSTRDDYLNNRDELNDEALLYLALHHPVPIAGPGNVGSNLSSQRLKEFHRRIFELITRLEKLPQAKYEIMMRAIRLVHLSISNKRDDFGLGYLLIVSAIESIAQHAVKRDKVKEAHPSEDIWSQKAKEDDAFDELLTAYRESRGQNKYLKARYIEFVIKFAPVKDWEQLVPPPFMERAGYIEESSPQHRLDHVLRRNPWEKFPVDLSIEKIHEILSNSYKHRSLFVHQGIQPPHMEPIPSGRFFQELISKDGTILLPNYELLLGIAQRSISCWAESLKT